MALRGLVCNATTSDATSITLSLAQTISSITSGADAVITFSTSQAANPYGVGSQLTVSRTGTNADGQVLTVTATGGSAGAWTVTTSFTTTGSGSAGTATIAIAPGDIVLFVGGGTNGLPGGFAVVPVVSRFANLPGVSTIEPTSSSGEAYYPIGWLMASGSETAFTATQGSGGGALWAAMAAIYSGRYGAPFAITPVVTPATTLSGSTSPWTITITGGLNGGAGANAGDDLVLFVGVGELHASPGMTPGLTPPTGFGNYTTSNSATTFGAQTFFCDNENVAAGTASGNLTTTLAGTVENNVSEQFGAYLISLAGLPIITSGPTAQVVSPGNTATLSVSATDPSGGSNVSYQWYVEGATSASYTTGTLTLANNGNSYYVTVTDNASGAVTLSVVAQVWVAVRSAWWN
jgi:hypothetical protein